jgi:protein-tyrosine-phosphatase
LIRGTLDEFSLPDIVGLLSRTGKTGALELSGPGGTGVIYFSEGAICGARCTRGREPLGRKLVRADILTEAQLQAALARQGQGRLPLGEALVRDGSVAHPDIEAALEEQIQDSVVGLLGLRPTDFTWASDIPEEVTATVDPEGLLASVEMRLGELEDIRGRLPDDRLELGLNPVGPVGGDLNITGEQWRVLAMFGTGRPLGDLVRYSTSGDFYTLKTIDELVSAGVLEMRGRPAPPPPNGASLPPPPLNREPADVRVEGVPSGRVIRLVDPSPSRFMIAVVSTFDRTRGPLAAALLRKATEGLPVEVGSFGIEPADPSSPTPGAVAAGAALGLDLSSHTPTRLVSGALVEADLVLGFEWIHLQRAVLDGHARRTSAFTVLELLSHLQETSADPLDAVERGRIMVQRAHQARVEASVGDVQLVGPRASADLGDTATFVSTACRHLVAGLFGLQMSGR